ncbi:hypothetical protein N0V90_012338 [Kalmusia sp. IMI 367209]|nr:hypothetical protein N0V90_012338 [Kalmusia sp. IMI 367209]
MRRYSSSYLDDFIAPIVARIKRHDKTAFALVIEPTILPFVVRNPYFKECATAQNAYRTNVPAAVKALDLPNTINYLDAAHGGYFGWTELRTKYDPKDIARELTATWENAGGSALKQFRGVAVNVKSYNSWDAAPGEAFSDEKAVCADLFNRARNEQQYISILGKSFKAINSSFPLHAIMDSSRNAVIGIRQYWHDWCNNLWAGIGNRPTLEVQQLIHARNKDFDALVWATPIGFSDGTSDTASPYWHANCSSKIAFQPMPENGVFSQSYFESLLSNARWSALQAFDEGFVEKDSTSKLTRRCDGRMM